jgi:hypothetical protein
MKEIYRYKNREDFLAKISSIANHIVDSVRDQVYEDWHRLKLGRYSLFIIFDGDRLLYAGAFCDTYEKRFSRNWNTGILEMGTYFAQSDAVPYQKDGFEIKYEFYHWKDGLRSFSKSDAMKAIKACAKEQAPTVTKNRSGPSKDDFWRPGHEEGITDSGLNERLWRN